MVVVFVVFSRELGMRGFLGGLGSYSKEMFFKEVYKEDRGIRL